MMAATIECGKLALAALPNVEVVTLLCALYGYCFGFLGVLSSLVFVAIEPMIWGFNTWVLTYVLYWPFVSLVFWFLHRTRVKNRWALTGVALLLVVWFGVLSSLVDVGLFSGFFDRFFYRFAIYYWRGIVFYIVELVTNAVLFPLLFPLLSEKLLRFSGRFLPPRTRPCKAGKPPVADGTASGRSALTSAGAFSEPDVLSAGNSPVSDPPPARKPSGSAPLFDETTVSKDAASGPAVPGGAPAKEPASGE